MPYIKILTIKHTKKHLSKKTLLAKKWNRSYYTMICFTSQCLNKSSYWHPEQFLSAKMQQNAQEEKFWI